MLLLIYWIGSPLEQKKRKQSFEMSMKIECMELTEGSRIITPPKKN